MARPEVNLVKGFVEIKLLNHILKLRRLTWGDYMNLTFEKEFRKVVLSAALVEVSGKPFTPAETLILLNTLPAALIDKIYTIYIGSLDDRRKFSSKSLTEAPTALEFSARMETEQNNQRREVDEVEQQLEARFGRQALEEEKALSARILQQSNYKKAIQVAKHAPLQLEEDTQ